MLRPEVIEGESEGEHAVWVMMPRATRPCFRYKKYGRVIPIRVTRPVARSLVLSGGETLEQALLESGVQSWPADGEMELYELLEGGDLGHVAAFETTNPGVAPMEEFEELTEPAAAMLTGNPRLAGFDRRRLGRRFYRLRFGGRQLRRRRRVFGIRFDLTAPQPVLWLHLRIGERDSHILAGQLERRDMVQALSIVRGAVGPAVRRGIAGHLEKSLKLTSSAAGGLADQLADTLLRALADQLPSAATALSRAAKDPASGVTFTFGFTFKDRESMVTAAPPSPTLTIRPGTRGD